MSEKNDAGDDIDFSNEGAWVLLEDGSLVYVTHQENGPKLRTDWKGRKWLKLAPELPIYPKVKEVEVEIGRPVFTQAPKYEAKQWQAKPKVKTVSLFSAALIMAKNLLAPHDEKQAQLDDIHTLIRSGHASRALGRLQQFKVDFPNDESKTLGLISLAHHALNEIDLAQEFHHKAYFVGAAHPAMLEIYGYPDVSQSDWLNPSDETENDN